MYRRKEMKNKSMKLQAQNATTGSTLLATLFLLVLVIPSGCRDNLNKGGSVQKDLGASTASLAASINNSGPNDGWTAAE
jgi:hypothetical protein